MNHFLREAKDLKGKRVLVRCDFNVEISKGVIVDDFRIRKTLPTIEMLRKSGSKVILIAHLENEEDDSLKPVAEYLKKLFPLDFVEDFTTPGAKEIFEGMKEGDVVLLQNLRHFEGEKKNDPAFAKQLANLGDIYVNEAFSVSHRPHASIVGVPKFILGYLGFLFETEIENLSKAFQPPHPFLFILAGAKFSTKLPLVEKFLKIADVVFIGGALANDLFKAKGYEVGKSLVGDAADFSSYINNSKIILPSDVTAVDGQVAVKKPDGLSKDDRMVDAGPETILNLKSQIAKAKFILWNGPLGIFEEGYKSHTLELAKTIAESKAETILGGGDTLAAIQELDLFSKFSFVSTGGGAMLDYLANETLPGIQAIEALS